MIYKIAVPTILKGLFEKSQEMINLIFLGHLDNKALIGGVGMGQAVIHLMGFSIILGLNSALDTLIS